MAKTESNRARLLREERGLSQLELAESARISRQSLSAIEAGRSRPSVDVALRIARALDASVEELFAPAPAASLVTEPADAKSAGRVAVASVAGRWVSYRLDGDLRTSADGIVRTATARRAEVEPMRSTAELSNNLVVMGCAAALGLLVDRLNSRAGAGRFLWLPRSSTNALEELAAARTHVAGVHLTDPKSGDANVPDVRRHVGEKALVLVTLAHWEAGLVVARGNPKKIVSAADLGRRGLRLVVREKGSGARRLLEGELRRAGTRAALDGAALLAAGHLEVARAIALGAADTGVATRDAALAFGHDFIPLASERYDLVLPLDALADPRMDRLLDMLSTASFRSELVALGYDVTKTGARAAEIRPG
jgi:molybdate-binding protein/transcriptional regulator with XRE-family HTH domain